MRLESKTAIVVGAGQGPGTGMGNGRATALRFAQEGAKVMAVDRELGLAEETAAMVRNAGGDCFAFEAGVTRESAMAAVVAEAKKRSGRIRLLHHKVRGSHPRRDARVPLRRKMGTAWDVADAALFLASDEANFITGVSLLVDGGGALDIGH